MKRIILTVLVFPYVISLLAQSQIEESLKSKVWRNQILVAPFYFFDNTFMVSYERIFPANGALRITPSITLSNIDQEREGIGLDLGYKAFIVDKSRLFSIKLLL